MGMALYLTIMKLQIFFTLFDLHLSHIYYKKMWDHMEINWYLVTLFSMQYMHLLDSINRYFVPIHIIKNVIVSINTAAIKNLYVKFWTRKSEFSLGNFLRSLTQTKITRQRSLELTDIYYYLIKD